VKAISHESIKLRAYEIWEESGRPHGCDKEHWEQAEKELLEAVPEVQPAAAAKPAAEAGAEPAAGEANVKAPARESAAATVSPAAARPSARAEAARTR